MDKNELLNRLNEIEKEITKLMVNIRNINIMCKIYEEVASIEEIEKMSDPALTQILITIKHVWNCIESIYRIQNYEEKISIINSFIFDEELIEITEKDGVWRIKLPSILPRKKQRKNIPNYTSAYKVPIIRALASKGPKNKPLQGRKAVLMIIYNFGPDRKIIDYDNFDYVHLINVLTAFFIDDDSPDYYDLIFTGRSADKSFTEILIADSSKLLTVLDEGGLI